MFKVLFLFLILFLISCDNGYPEKVISCSPQTMIKIKANKEDNIHLRASFNNWEQVKMNYENGEYSIKLNILPGDYAYKFESKNKNDWFLDPNNKLTIFKNGIKASRLIVKDCKKPSIKLENFIKDKNYFSFDVKFNKSALNSYIDLSKSVIKRNNKIIKLEYNHEKELFHVEENNLNNGKYTYLFKVYDENNQESKELFIPIWIEENKFSYKDAIIYQIMTDRFLNGDVNNDSPVEDPKVDYKANFQGGDFRGIINKIDDNYFSDIGINVIWISSPLLNTSNSGKGMGTDERYYASYHSYWPISTGWSYKYKIKDMNSPIEKHFGTKEELHELIEKAHKKGIRVFFDIIPNHVHTQSEMWKKHNDSWFNLNSDGSPYICGWEKPITCWFNPYLADINHENIEASNFLIEHFMWLAKEFDIDGFRIDAVRLMILDFVKTLNFFIKEELETTGNKFFTIGETFTGEIEQELAFETIGYYLGEDALDSQFNFPLFHEISRTFLLNNENFIEFNNFLEDKEYKFNSYYDSAIMGNFIGNHDICRALSVANGDFDNNSTQGGHLANIRVWDNEPKIPKNLESFKKLSMSHAFLLSTPLSAIVVYQGDEFGMPGANDPDNRRMMIFDDDLTILQRNTLEKFKKLTHFRNNHDAIRYGVRKNILIEENTWAYIMQNKDEKVLFVFNKGNTKNITIDIEGNKILDIDNKELNIINNKLELSLGKMEYFIGQIK